MSAAPTKMLDRGALGRFRAEHAGARIVFTNGCFDILHRGHIELLETARGYGDLLVVGVNSDGSVRRLKGAGRPIFPAEDRARVLAALEAVSFVVVFDEDTPAETIRALAPDVLVKGAEYGAGEIVGEEFVKSRGGRVERVPMREGFSTTALIERIRR